MFPALLLPVKSFLLGLSATVLAITPIQQAIHQVQAQVQANGGAPNIGSSGTSQNWSGYQTNNGSYTSVSGSWIVPQVSTSGHTATDATWVGIGGVSSSDLIQSGTENVISPTGQVTTSAFYELLPDASIQINAITVKPGDSVSVSITQQATNQWLIHFTDNTTNQSTQQTVQYTSSMSSAEWVEEAPSNGFSVLPLDNFGTVQFTGGATTQNGTQVSLSGSNATEITMVNARGQVVATPSALDADGASFSVTRSSAATTAPLPNFDQNPDGWRRRGIGIGSYIRTPRRNRVVWVIPSTSQPQTSPTVEPSDSPAPSNTPSTENQGWRVRRTFFIFGHRHF